MSQPSPHQDNLPLYLYEFTDEYRKQFSTTGVAEHYDEAFKLLKITKPDGTITATKGVQSFKKSSLLGGQ